MKKLNDREAADKIISQCPACGEEWSGGSGYDAYLAGRSAPSVIAMRDALVRVNEFLAERKIYDNTNGAHTRLLEFMQVTEAIAAYDREVGGE